MLIENYKVFRRIMLEYSLELKKTIPEIANFLLPLDLFRFTIIASVEADKLIEFVNTSIFKYTLIINKFIEII